MCGGGGGAVEISRLCWTPCETDGLVAARKRGGRGLRPQCLGRRPGPRRLGRVPIMRRVPRDLYGHATRAVAQSQSAKGASLRCVACVAYPMQGRYGVSTATCFLRDLCRVSCVEHPMEGRYRTGGHEAASGTRLHCTGYSPWSWARRCARHRGLNRGQWTASGVAWCAALYPMQCLSSVAWCVGYHSRLRLLQPASRLLLLPSLLLSPRASSQFRSVEGLPIDA